MRQGARVRGKVMEENMIVLVIPNEVRNPAKRVLSVRPFGLDPSATPQDDMPPKI